VTAKRQDPYYIDSLGWAYYKLGRNNDAVRELRRAVRLCPDSGDLRYHLGAAYARVGKPYQARIELEKAIICGESNPQARALILKMKTSHKRITGNNMNQLHSLDHSGKENI
jgi:Flp pilus assembly protein TadD